MSPKKYEHIKEYSFHGEFWQCPDDSKGRFSAKIEYSSYHGLILDYCISDSDGPDKCERLYGYLNTGEQCTLIGPFDFTQGGFHLGKGFTRTGRHGFAIILFNGFYDENQKIEYCELSLHGLQEFIHPQGFITQLKHQNAPIFSASAEDWKIELINNSTFSVVGDGLLNIIYCQDADALTKLSDEFLKIKELHPTARFSIRKELTFYFRFKNHNYKNIKEHMLNIWKISGLISILTDKPTLPDELYIKFEGSSTRTPCLLTTRFEQRTIDLALKEFHHRSLPINWRSIDIEKAFEKWFEIYDRYIPLTITYQYETGYRTLHQAHSDIILFATQIEAINSTLGGEKKEKYIKPIDEYASTFLRQKMNNFFIRFNNKSLGENIATLRNELAHVDRDKELMTQMTLDEYIRIGLCLRLIITSHLLSNLGIEKEHIQQYQNRVAQD